MSEYKIRDKRGFKLHVYKFDDVKNPKGVIQVLHGINEHGLRYVEFAEVMNKAGYVVFVHDHISQGKSRTSLDGDVVYFTWGVSTLLDGINAVRKEIRRVYKGLDIYLIGHSMGALLSRRYLNKFDNEYKKVILIGTGYSKQKGLGLVILMGDIIKLFGRKKPSKFFDNMFRKTQLKLNEKVEIEHFIEWLTRDKMKTEINKNDNYLYIRLSVSAFVDLLRIIKKVSKKPKHIDQKILLLSGTHDPSTAFGEDTKKLAEEMELVDIDVTLKLYEEARHDLLQETNRTEVFTDILNFIKE
ncbi:hypothetical protein CI105_03470 [Candidatus Izimaplasma bacterium ZiA1]|uniref:alpha/beta hydrolase n=1 Tax=Candidatus Izimoplasma sp. ZiA1 TaxID=2024899 RepID=UPI000BAA7A8F|nr:hypothetical protein CI105_03470 [Candidatus Izimaplasma bacterium ZiA1]